jgi:hypothetical protein
MKLNASLIQPRWMLAFSDRALFAVVFILLAYAVLHDLDINYDNIAYQIPFAARRAGLIPKEAYAFGLWLEQCYASFPPLPYYINGYFWRLTGTPNGGAMISLVAFSGFCVLLNRLFRVPLLLLFIGFAAIPAIQVNIIHGTVDLTANLAFASALIMATFVLIDRWNAWWALGALTAAALAGNYKPQFIPLAGAFAAAFVVALLLFRERREFISSIGQRKTVYWILFALAIIGCYDMAIRNLILFGNPLYPIQLKVLGVTLPGTSIGALYSQPLYLHDAPQQWRWFLSILDYKALGPRPLPYLLGMGDVPWDSPAASMGGYFSFFVLFNLWLFFASAWSKGVSHRWLALCFIIGSIAVASTPSSHDLRYFSFWIIYLVTMNFAYLWYWNSEDVTGRRYYTAVAISAFLFICAITGGVNFLNFGRSLQKMSVPIDAKFVSKFENGKRYCLLNWNQIGILATAPLHPGRSYSVLYGRSEEECKEAKAIPVDFNAPSWP